MALDQPSGSSAALGSARKQLPGAGGGNSQGSGGESSQRSGGARREAVEAA